MSQDNSQLTADNNWLDEMVDLEQQWVRSGMRDGLYDALKVSHTHGQKLGTEYGQDIGEESGFYNGILLSFLFSICSVYEQAVAANEEFASLHPQQPNITLSNINNHSYTLNEYKLPEDVPVDDEPYLGLVSAYKSYNKTFFEAILPSNKENISLVHQYILTRLNWSFLKYKGIVSETISLLSVVQALRGIPGEDGDVHHIADLRIRIKALFARMGIGSVFKNDNILEM